MRAVAVGAHRGLLRAGGDGVSVHALLVRSDHLRALSAVLHHKFLAVAGAAGRGNVGVVHARFRIAGRQQFMRAAVAIHAGRRLAVAALDGFAVETAIVGRLLSAWQVAQLIFSGGVSCAELFTSVWQSTQVNMLP